MTVERLMCSLERAIAIGVVDKRDEILLTIPEGDTASIAALSFSDAKIDPSALKNAVLTFRRKS